MSHDNAFHAPRRRFRFSLLALLLFVTAVCIAVAWFAQPKRCRAVALFHVDSSPISLMGKNDQRFDPQEYETLQKTQLALLKSNFVLQAAVRNPAIAALKTLSSQPDPVVWLAENIEVEFPVGSEILSISLAGTESQANDLRQIVDVVAKAYEDEVLYTDRQKQLVNRDSKARAADSLRKRIDEILKVFSEAAVEGNSDNPDIKLRQIELDVLINRWKQLLDELEIANIESSAPDRVQQIQNAVIQSN